MEEGTNEITVVLSSLEAADLTDWVLTTDALLAQQKVAEAILAQRGDYLMVVKQNQPTLYEDISLLIHRTDRPSSPLHS